MEIEAELQSVEDEMKKVENAMARQAEFDHQYWSAAAEDIASATRDWVPAHAAIRDRAGMEEMGLPLPTNFD